VSRTFHRETFGMKERERSRISGLSVDAIAVVSVFQVAELKNYRRRQNQRAQVKRSNRSGRWKWP